MKRQNRNKNEELGRSYFLSNAIIGCLLNTYYILIENGWRPWNDLRIINIIKHYEF